MFHDIVPLFRLNLPLFKTKKAPKFKTKKAPKFRCFVIWLRGPDLNRRPSGYEPDELPSCSTPRLRVRNILVSKIIARFKLNLTFCLLRK